MILYHVTYKLSQAETYNFVPRIPETISVDEDIKTPRICFADSIENCMRAIGGSTKFEQEISLLRVYKFEVSENDENLICWEKLYQNNLVADAELTHEYWYLKEVSLSSKIYRIENIRYNTYTIVSNLQKNKIIEALKACHLYSSEIERYTASYIINKWLRDKACNSDEVEPYVKQMLYHEEVEEEVNSPEIYKQLFGEVPKMIKKIADYYDVEMLEDCEIIEVSKEYLQSKFRFIKCLKSELLKWKSELKLQLCWEILSEDYIWENDCYLYKIENLADELVAFLYVYQKDMIYEIQQFEVLRTLRSQGIGRKIILQYLNDNNIDIENVTLIPLCEESEKFWKKCGINCSLV